MSHCKNSLRDKVIRGGFVRIQMEKSHSSGCEPLPRAGTGAMVLGLARFRDGEGNGTPLQYSCLENPMDRGAWKAAVHGVTEGWT